MHVFHFGSSRKRLLGVYHPAASDTGRAGAIVLCQPFGHEYIRSHRAIRNLAESLSGIGMHVLRFDYYGCGDSDGDAAEGSLSQWRDDIATAIDELKDMTSHSRVSIAGVRVGASLAAMACADRRDVNTLMLWDPVLRGREYIDELTRLQIAWATGRPRLRQSRLLSNDPGELLGFPLSAALRDEFNQLNLLALATWPAKQHVVIVTQHSDGDQLASHLQTRTAPVVEQSEQDCQWQRPSAVHSQLLANDVLQSIVRYFEKGQTS